MQGLAKSDSPGLELKHGFVHYMKRRLQGAAGNGGEEEDAGARGLLTAQEEGHYSRETNLLIQMSNRAATVGLGEEDLTAYLQERFALNAAAFSHKYLQRKEGLEVNSGQRVQEANDDVVAGFAALAGMDPGHGVTKKLIKYLLPDQQLLGVEFVTELAGMLAGGGTSIHSYHDKLLPKHAGSSCALHERTTVALQSLLQGLLAGACRIEDAGHRTTFVEFCQVCFCGAVQLSLWCAVAFVQYLFC
jgi:hypothetical protein